MWIEILFTAAYFFLFNYLLYRFSAFRFRAYKSWVTVLLFNVKIVAGFALWAIYTFYYRDLRSNDIHKFYQDALVLHQLGLDHPLSFLQLLIGNSDEWAVQSINQMQNWYRNFDTAPVNENQTMIRLNAILMFVSGRVYFVHILFMCFLSLMGFVLMINALFKERPQAALAALPVMFLPSVLLWMSGVLKEPLLVFAIGLWIHTLVYFKTEVASVIKLFAVSVFIVYIKFYVLLCLLPACAAFLWCRFAVPSFRKYVLVYAAGFILVWLFSSIQPERSLLRMLSEKQKHSFKEAVYFKAGSQLSVAPVNTWTDLLKASPNALWNVFFKPMPQDAKNIMMLLSAMENVFVLAYICYHLFHFSGLSISSKNVFYMLLFGSVGYFLLIGIVTPVAGNLVRYKAPLLPLFLFSLSMAATWPKWLQEKASAIFSAAQNQ